MISNLLRKLYGKKKDGGVGFTSNALNNSLRKAPSGWMTSFGIWKFVRGVVKYYSNTQVGVGSGQPGDDSSYEIIGRITAIIYDYMTVDFPDVLNEIQRDNKETHGNHRPPYIREGKIISPRMIISSLLGNEAHVDAGDKGRSAVVWVAENPDDTVHDWQFILQTLRTHEQGKIWDTITVQLFHGIVIIYDGRAVRHATSLPDADTCNKWGVFHGSI